MTEITFDNLASWLADDEDENYDITDFVTEFSQLIGIMLTDGEVVVPSSARVAVAAGGAALGGAAVADAPVPAYKELTPKEARKAERDAFYTELEDTIEEVIEDNFGINEDTDPTEIFDVITENLLPD
ncbi:MAG: hypothetical protein FWG82_00365 [Oscillospiraceae bacterium]|nr:hypothetical protein [Oscillospiraceae bacterium]